ncbi:hypothetical protein AtNW77_Chr1g0010581 [Arabidopsis thaliana]
MGCNDDASDLITNPVLAPVMQQTCLQVFFRLVDVEVLKLGSDKKGESVGRLIRAGGESHEDHHQVMLDEIINYVQSLQQQVEGKNIPTMQVT